MNRRAILASAVTVAGTVAAGCLGDEGETDEVELEMCVPPVAESEADAAGGEANGDHALEPTETMARAVDGDVAVLDWWTDGSFYHLEYTGGDGPDADIPLFAAAYVDAVADGFGYNAMPTAFDDEDADEPAYMFIIQPDWVAELAAGERTRTEYHDSIREMIH